MLALAVLGGSAYAAHTLLRWTPGVYLGRAHAPEQPRTAAPATEAIFYTSLRPSNWDVFLFPRLGAAAEQLTDDPAPDYNATLSPGGRWVVFTSERDGNADLFALDLESRGAPVALTRDGGFDDAASFSPDGRTIAFVSTRSGSPDLYTIDFRPGDAGAEARARRLTSDPAGEFNPRFSPDGRTIAFTSNRDLLWRWHPLRLIDQQGIQTRVYTVGVDGTDLRRVTAGIGLSGRPAWSPDGTTLYYYKATAETTVAVHAIGRDGTGDRRLTPGSMVALTPAVLAGGDLVFVRLGFNPTWDFPVLDKGGALHRMRSDGSGIAPAGGTDDRKYSSPNCDPASGRLVAHAPGSVDRLPLVAPGAPLSWPAARRTVALGDRTVELRPLRLYFPSFSAAANRGVGGRWLYEASGTPPGPSPIVAFDAEGTRATALWQPDKAFAWGPVISRDGRRIVFSVGPRFGKPGDGVDVWRAAADGTGAVNLTADSPGNDAFPDLSADGERVAFRSGRSGDQEIYVMDIGGGGVRRVSTSPGTDTMPALSPDGRTVVYTTARGGRGLKLWIQAVDDAGDAGRALEPERAEVFGLDMHPRFSPDGRWIVFTSDRAGFRDEWYLSALMPQPYGDLFAVRVDGGAPAVQLTDDKWEDGLPFWSTVR